MSIVPAASYQVPVQRSREARIVIGDFKADHNRRHRYSVLGCRPRRVRCRCSHIHYPVACGIN